MFSCLSLEYRDAKNSFAMAKIIVTILALASVHHQVRSLRTSEMGVLFADLHEAFPTLVPNFYFKNWGEGVISGFFSRALHEVYSLWPDFENLNPASARKQLERVAGKEGGNFVVLFKPCAELLAQLIKEKFAKIT